jgi:thymidine kinase
MYQKTESLCNQHTVHGMLEVICGPMFSGKSEELIRRLRRAKIAQQRVITFKPQIDNRYGLEYVVSHDGNKVDAKPLAQVHEIIEIVHANNAMVIGIDEAQFFSQELVSVVCQLINENRRVIVAGLDLDFRGTPFGCMPLLLAIADKVSKLQAICTQCGHDAHFTQRLVNGNPARYDDPVIMIGAQEAYQARCRGCYVIDKVFVV